ncbi:acetyl-CoA carboxylase biotin carboxyl carrier protein [Bombilactobacillus bombi]|uniref:acetyl-CoA carboxylase biotin carboxyl carrier protein n=1 Tax=Bombilactobacillus bombi TaxID=1303590 RepID=UPI0015E5F562|nr:acetyl-CoA carboxylase biotin carboxyl carrier protein [Bombilactobacillus bombi]MBA1433926.1 acetyl-CoA carboxylase biotin carboxyl carrier protein [Bombilactobacillus bombi]
MTFEEIQKLMQQLNQSDFTELELDFDGGHLYLNKNKTATQAVKQIERPNLTPSNQQTESSTSTTKTNKIDADFIKAPLVGIVYLQSSPEQPPYKKVGDHVSKGDVVCVIEAMKMMTKVKSQISGTISEILVSDEEVVEYNQPLIKVTQ